MYTRMTHIEAATGETESANELFSWCHCDTPDSSRWCNIDVTFFFDIVLFSIPPSHFGAAITLCAPISFLATSCALPFSRNCRRFSCLCAVAYSFDATVAAHHICSSVETHTKSIGSHWINSFIICFCSEMEKCASGWGWLKHTAKYEKCRDREKKNRMKFSCAPKTTPKHRAENLKLTKNFLQRILFSKRFFEDFFLHFPLYLFQFLQNCWMLYLNYIEFDVFFYLYWATRCCSVFASMLFSCNCCEAACVCVWMQAIASSSSSSSSDVLLLAWIVTEELNEHGHKTTTTTYLMLMLREESRLNCGGDGNETGDSCL